MKFLSVADNLRDSFRILATGRPRADVMEMPGISLASLGVEFQMFNAAFLSAPVETEDELQQLLTAAQDHFSARGMPWSFWFCEDWLSRKVRRKLSQICLGYRLRLAAEMPGMVAAAAEPANRKRTPELDMRRVESIHTLAHFQAIGSTCFHVPIRWFSEVFNEDLDSRREFVCWVGYRDGVPVATAASVVSAGVIGIYNVATLPSHRQHGYGELITRHAINSARQDSPAMPLVLQSTDRGLSIYERMGFRAVTRILVYNSGI